MLAATTHIPDAMLIVLLCVAGVIGFVAGYVTHRHDDHEDQEENESQD